MALSPFLDRLEIDPAVPEDADLPPAWDHERVVELVGLALLPRLEVALGPFIKGLRRRLSRDQDRLHR